MALLNGVSWVMNLSWTTWFVAILMIAAVYWYLFAVRVFSPVPGPRITYPFSPLVEMIKDDPTLGKHHLWLDRCRRTWGGIVRMHAEWRTSYLVFSPDALKHVLQTAWMKYDHSPKLMQTFGPIAGGLVLQPNGEAWHHDRELFELGFKSMRLNRAQEILTSKVSKVIEILNKSLQAGETVELQSLFGCMTFDVISIFTLGHDFNTLEDPHARINKAWANTLEYLMWVMFVPRYHKIYETAWIRKGKEDLKYLEEQFFQIIRHRQENPVEGDESLLGLILQSSQEHPGRYTLESIKTHMMTFLFAGHDTTANALGWLVYLVSTHPDVETKLIAELDGLKGPIDASAFHELPYLHAVVKETLRLKPSAPSLGRVLKEDDTFNGYTFAKNSPVGYSPYVTHRDENYWTNPDAFTPERFLPENYKNIHPYQYIPFGGGPRRCIGEQLAMREIKTAAAMILPLFRFTPLAGHPIEECVRTTMSARYGIPMTLAARKEKA